MPRRPNERPNAPDYWHDLGDRYKDAAKKLQGDEKRIAQKRSDDCYALEKAVQKFIDESAK